MSVWDELQGSRAIEGLARQVRSGTPAHAWLLLGPSGSGKRAAAAALAAALNCRVEPGTGCGTCTSCALVARDRHPDVHHIVPEGPLIPVDVVREQITPEAARSPFEAPYKVFILEEAERMNDAAQNALLKTLEEPQPDTVFVLISDNEEELLETVRSRCRIIRLDPVAEARIVELLAARGATRTEAELAARVSEGDFERAAALAFDDATRARRRVWAALPGRLTSPLAALDAAVEVIEEARAAVKEREGAQRREVVELAEAMGEGRGTVGARNALAKRHRRELKRLEEEVIGEALGYLASFYRDVVVLRRGARAALVNLDAPDALEQWAAAGTSERALLRASERCLAALASFAFNANPTVAVEATLVHLSTLGAPESAPV